MTAKRNEENTSSSFFNKKAGESLGLQYEKVEYTNLSFRDVNHGFCSHLGCSGRNATIFS